MSSETELYANTLRTLATWKAYNKFQENLRRRFLDYATANRDALSRESNPTHLTPSWRWLATSR
jgi:hypothetical protein